MMISSLHTAHRPRIAPGSMGMSTIRVARSLKKPMMRHVIAKYSQDESPSLSPLLLAFHAARHSSSLFASQCLVESILDLHLNHYGFSQIQMAIKLALLSQGMTQSSALNQSPLFDEEVLSALVALVLITARWLSLSEDQLEPIDQGCNQDQIRLLVGMRSYVLQTLKQYDTDGLTLDRLTALQGAAMQVEMGNGGGSVSTMQQMQMFTKTILLTVEVASALGLPPGLSPLSGRPLSPPSAPLCVPATGYIPSLLGLPSNRSRGTADQQPLGRSAAVQLLVCFIGAVTASRSSRLSFVKFVQIIYESYLEGITARQLFASLTPSDFTQSGGLIRAVSEVDDINSKLFSFWVSTSYIAFAQLGLQHPSVESRGGDGWAWSGEGDENEALGVDSFVKGALHSAWAYRKEASTGGGGGGGGGGQDGDVDGSTDDERWSGEDREVERESELEFEQGSLLRRWLSQRPELGAVLEEQRQKEAASFLSENKLRGKEMPLLVKVEDEQLAQSSPVIRVIDMQRRLVAEVLDFALQAQAATR